MPEAENQVGRSHLNFSPAPQIKSRLIAGGRGVEARHKNAIQPILGNGGQISQQQD